LGVPLLVLSAAAGILFSAAVLWCAYALACRFIPSGPTSVRFVGASIVLTWVFSAALLLLSPVHLFRAEVVLPLSVLAAVLAHRNAARLSDPRTMLSCDLGATRSWWHRMTRPYRILIGVGVGCVAVRLLHGLLAPCLTWDALTYHLYKPAVWVQSHAIVNTSGPDAAGYYAWFPPYGDALWGWWLLVMRVDVANAPIAVAQWLLIPLAAYSLARALGATILRATAAAFAIAFTPSVINLSAAVYVDNLVVALWLAALVFLVRALDHHRSADAALASAAFAILAGVKASVLPISGLGILTALVAVRSRLAAVSVIGAAIPSLVPSVHAWVSTGSPVYPLTLRIGEHVIFAGNAELDWLLSAAWMTPLQQADAKARLFGRLFLPWVKLNTDFFNLGLGPLFLLLPAATGTLWLCRRRGGRFIVAFLVVSALLTIATIAGDSNAALRLWWWGLLGRLLMISVAALAVLAAAWPSHISTVSLFICAAAGLLSAWPRGVSGIDVGAVIAVWPYWAVIVLIVIASRRLPRFRTSVHWFAVIAAVAALLPVRDRYRYSFYDAAAKWVAYDTHPIDARWTASWPIWQRLDTAEPKIVAVTAGFDGIGHNWYRYPLLGSRLQNQLLYLPITPDGRIFDYGLSPDRRPRISCDAWLLRVAASNARYLVLLSPLPPEAAWVSRMPRIFVREIEIPLYRSRLYSINTAALSGPAKISCPAD
jgi:hypothetical protein